MLDAVDGVSGPVTVMEGEGQALHVVEQLSAKVPNQLLTCIGLQVPTGQTLKVGEQSDDQKQGNGEANSHRARAHRWKEMDQKIGQGLLAEHAVHSDLQGQWVKQGEGHGKQAERRNAGQVRPAAPRLAQDAQPQRMTWPSLQPHTLPPA
jgi:hypothetical protein